MEYRNMNDRVLVVEDEDEIRQLIAIHLQRSDLIVDQAASAEEAESHLSKNKYHLVLVDWMLPGQSGISLIQKVRSQSNSDDMSILMVTARSDAQDIISGLDAGADDFVSKPFDPSVLMARVRALLRRRPKGIDAPVGEEQIGSVLQIGPLQMDVNAIKVFCCGEEIHLTISEFKLLHALMMNRGRVLTRDRLIDQVQGEGVSVTGRTVDTHIFGLRKKLGEFADLVETVRGVGYRVKSTGESEK